MTVVKLGKTSETLRLSILPLSYIKPHESTIPRELDTLARDMQRTGFQRDPILIDSRTHVALDGMHRRAALEKLGAINALCAEYDYLGDDVKLERWLRYIIAPSKQLLNFVTDQFNMEECRSTHVAITHVDRGRSSISLLSSKESFASNETRIPISKSRIFAIYEGIRKFDRFCNSAKVEIGFVGESEKRRLYSSRSVYVLYPAPLGKKEILDFARRGEVLPFKTTRHIVPVRPMGIYFPLEKLRQSSVNDCNRTLNKIVALSTIKMERRNVWYEGRRYSEPLAVFRRHHEAAPA